MHIYILAIQFGNEVPTVVTCDAPEYFPKVIDLTLSLALETLKSYGEVISYAVDKKDHHLIIRCNK